MQVRLELFSCTEQRGIQAGKGIRWQKAFYIFFFAWQAVHAIEKGDRLAFRVLLHGRQVHAQVSSGRVAGILQGSPK